ncbi:hypothetical protein H257_10321 [Aphanomyces astaci]|uniref:Uncharacterized protein n=1 Tax=Aphanomyces astaci TaxID=112090 RepID=W4G8V0_APHAT|nr:hypothetical protein H257_10321 [Aphanomyces astaci]ETV75489.1 hypothetical protein H257_10321 [Aphanomyces astaci]|eukprot:XP_009835123.1 hypothetical protein H257_10321 [Aphanomyces astaci]
MSTPTLDACASIAVTGVVLFSYTPTPTWPMSINRGTSIPMSVSMVGDTDLASSHLECPYAPTFIQGMHAIKWLRGIGLPPQPTSVQRLVVVTSAHQASRPTLTTD